MSEAATAPAATSDTGGTLLTTGIPAAPAKAPPPAAGSAEAAIQAAVDGPPEWAPAKFWDAEKKAVRTEDLAKGYMNLEKLLGREKVPVPVGDDDEEGWQRWYAATGRPDSPDKYEFERPTLPDGLPYDEDLEKSFRTYAHVNGLSPKQARNIHDAFVKTQSERHASWQQNQKQASSQAEQALRREYGAKYEQAVGQAKSALAQYADPEYYRYLEETGQGNDPRVIRAWIKVGQEMGGDTKIVGKPQSQAAPADLEKAIGDFRAKNEKALFNKDHPDHDRLAREYSKLFEARYAE